MSATPARSRLVPAALLAGILLGTTLLLAEGALRLAAAVDDDIAAALPDPMRAKIEPHGELGFRPRAGERFDYRNGTFSVMNDSGYRGPVVAVPKPAGTYRIILLGGSTSHGWGVNEGHAIDAHLRAELARRHPGRRIEVVNLAFDGYDSYQDFERLRSDGMPMEPDLVIVNSGINDVRNAKIPNLADRDPRSMQWGPVLARLRAEQAEGGPAPKTLVKHWLYAARVPSLVRDRVAMQRNAQRVRQGGAPLPAGMLLDAPVEVPAANPQAADYFERNLQRVAKLTAATGTPLLFSTPPSALRYLNPAMRSGIEYWLANATLTQAFRDTLDTRMRRVADSLAASGRVALHLRHDFQQGVFLDDCHLTPEGNAQLARAFADAITPLLEANGAGVVIASGVRGS